MLTVDEIIERLLTEYEVDDIITLLDIRSEELLERFDDKIDEHYDAVMEALDE